ncbi:MAG: hypothetical protein ABSG38_20840 [Spirochaetia bacterium]|jgi:hypothetical protein
MEGKGYTSIDEYIRSFPKEIQSTLQALRALMSGNLVHFAAHSRK